jgi:hypothetical protein
MVEPKHSRTPLSPLGVGTDESGGGSAIGELTAELRQQQIYVMEAERGEDGRGHRVTDPCHILLLWPEYPMASAVNFSLDSKLLLLTKTNEAFEALLDLWWREDPDQYFFAQAVKGKVRPSMELVKECVQRRDSQDAPFGLQPFFAYEAIPAVMFGRAHQVPREQILSGYDRSQVGPIDHNWVDLLRYRDVLLVAADNLALLHPSALAEESLSGDKLLKVAFPKLMEVLQHQYDVAIVASALPHFIPPIIGWSRIRAVGLPSAEHTKDGHLPNELTGAKCVFFHSFLPPYLRPPAQRETAAARAVRVFGGAQYMRQQFAEKHEWLTVDAGAAGERCQVYLADHRGKLAAVIPLLRDQRGQLVIPPGPYHLGELVKGIEPESVNLSLEYSGGGLGDFHFKPSTALGMGKLEFIFRYDEGWTDPWKRGEDELAAGILRFFRQAVSDTICIRLHDDGQVDDKRGKTSVPKGDKRAYEERQIRAIVDAAVKAHLARSITCLEIMIPNVESVSRYDRVRKELHKALAAKNLGSALDDGLVVLIPMVEGPAGAKALERLVIRGEKNIRVIALGVSDAAQRWSDAENREVPELRVMPPSSLEGIGGVCRQAQEIGARVRAAGHVAQTPGNFLLLWGLGAGEVVVPPDNMDTMLEMVRRVSRADCVRLVEQCRQRGDLAGRVAAVDRVMKFRGVESRIWAHFAEEVRSGRDLLE